MALGHATASADPIFLKDSNAAFTAITSFYRLVLNWLKFFRAAQKSTDFELFTCLLQNRLQ